MNALKFLLISFILLLPGCVNNDVTIIEASGTIEGVYVTLSAKTGGDIKSFFKDEGMNVNIGDTILIVDHKMLQFQLQQAEAVIMGAKAQLKLLKTGARKEDIKQAEALLNQSKVTYESALTDKERMKNLYETKSINLKQYEDAVTRYKITLAQYNSARENHNKIKQLARPEEITQSEANLSKAIAAADIIRKNINDCFVKSPIKGIISKKYIERGEFALPASSLVKISRLDNVELIIYVSTEELGYVKPGMKADVTVDTFKDKIFPGKVIYISPEAEFTPRNIQTKDERTKLVFAVKIKIPNPDYELKPGMPADAVLHINK